MARTRRIYAYDLINVDFSMMKLIIISIQSDVLLTSLKYYNFAVALKIQFLQAEPLIINTWRDHEPESKTEEYDEKYI
jgi:hypothetical protein